MLTPRTLLACLVTLGAAACAEGGSPTFTPTLADASNDLADAPADAASDADDASDVVAFDLPTFDVPAHDAADEEDAVDAADVAPDATADAAPDAPPRRVDHCFVTDPPTMDAAPGAASAPVGAAVFVAGVTPGAGQGADVSVELGVGAGGVDPLGASATWAWSAMAYDRDVDGAGATAARDYDRYQGTFRAPTIVGEYAYAARARVGAGPWTACDLVAALPARAYQPAFAGRVTVSAADARRVGYCNLQFPRALSLAANATGAASVFGRAFAAGVTNRGCADVPAPADFAAQWGYGPENSYPSSATWAWSDGRYGAHRDSTNPLVEGNCANVEYQATPRAPMDCATRAYAWRFRLGAGPWTYCRWAPPAEGAPTTPPFDTYVPSLAGTMTVTGCL